MPPCGGTNHQRSIGASPRDNHIGAGRQSLGDRAPTQVGISRQRMHSRVAQRLARVEIDPRLAGLTEFGHRRHQVVAFNPRNSNPTESGLVSLCTQGGCAAGRI